VEAVDADMCLDEDVYEDVPGKEDRSVRNEQYTNWESTQCQMHNKRLVRCSSTDFTLLACDFS